MLTNDHKREREEREGEGERGRGETGEPMVIPCTCQ